MAPSSRMSSSWQRHAIKLVVFAVLAILVVVHFSSSTFPKVQIPGQSTKSSKASYVSPATLMARPLAGAQGQIPKLFHQSWSSNTLPAKFEHWSDTCRKAHPDWEWVLWTDEDNMELVKRFFPDMLPTIERLPGPIFQADLVRSAYMYLFGGVYADLDTECLLSSDELFARYGVSTAASESTPSPPGSEFKAKKDESDTEHVAQKVFVGRMGTDNGFEHSIPNAWMASPPRHPFFKFMLQWTKETVMSGDKLDDRPEAVTGPIALRNGINKFNSNEFRKTGAGSLEGILAGPPNPSVDFDKATIEVLPAHFIYPYSWSRDGDMFREFCSAASGSFNAQRCKDLIAADRWPSYAVTYWSHTWEWTGHNDANLERISSMKGS